MTFQQIFTLSYFLLIFILFSWGIYEFYVTSKIEESRNKTFNLLIASEIPVEVLLEWRTEVLSEEIEGFKNLTEEEQAKLLYKDSWVPTATLLQKR